MSLCSPCCGSESHLLPWWIWPVFADALPASGMLQALVFLNGFMDLFLIKSQDVILHSLPGGLTSLNVFEDCLEWYCLSSSLFSLPCATFVPVELLVWLFMPWCLPATRRAASCMTFVMVSAVASRSLCGMASSILNLFCNSASNSTWCLCSSLVSIFLGHMINLALLSLVLIQDLPQTILWSLPVFMLLNTDRSEKIPCLSVRM